MAITYDLNLSATKAYAGLSHHYLSVEKATVNQRNSSMKQNRPIGWSDW